MYSLLTDGTTVEIRPATAGDFGAVKVMFEAMSPDNIYLRFFNLSRLAAENEARRICHDPSPDQLALLALADGEVAGCGSYDVLRGHPEHAEVAFAVADHMHHKGIATLLLEHLISHARSRQITTFTAETLTENKPMLNVFADAGLPVIRHAADGVYELSFPLPSGTAGATLDSYLATVADREGRADTASLRHVLAPESVVVIGASRQRDTVGRAILDNIRAGGYPGRLYVVQPDVDEPGGECGLASALDLPEAVDLAVITVPAAAVLGVAERCGRRGVRALVVITSGLDTAARAGLLAVCRRHGMRLVGPDSFGVAVPGAGLDVTFAADRLRPGVAGLVSQSGGLGFAVADQLSRLGIGVSSFASVGDKLDVSSNDMLMWWERDGLTKLAVLYISSFGNPRKFARTARRVAASMPVLTVHAGRSAARQHAATSDTAAVATPLASREALFAQAGIVVAPGLGELIDAAALLASQPVPAGRTVAIVSSTGGAAALAADACADRGLAVYHPHEPARQRLRALVPDGGSVAGPVDTTATVSGAAFRQCLELLAAEEDVQAVIALILPTAATGDLVAAIQEADVPIPLAAVVLGQQESVRLIPRIRPGAEPGTIPSYSYPETAVAALARAAAHGDWQIEPRGQVPSFPDVRTADARALIGEFLAGEPGDGWLAPDATAELLRCYGIPLVELIPVPTEDAAAGAARHAGYPVALKADVPGLVHKADAGAVELDLRGESDVRCAYQRLTERFGTRLRGILLQPMITGGTEMIAGVADDRMFGSLVVFGLGGVTNDVLADHAARLTPLTDADADRLIRSLRSAPLLLGYRGRPAADLDALRDLLLRLSRLADDLPEIAEVDLSPVIARPDGVFAVNARIKVTPSDPQDPFLRKLR